MEQFSDIGIVLSVRPHGESGAVATLLTENAGLYSGYVYGAQAASKNALLEPGTEVSADWTARTSDQLGRFKLEKIKNWSGAFLDERDALTALLSACALCDRALPEREAHPEIFHGLKALFQSMDQEIWAAAYVMWEVALLRELGFALDLSKCAGGGDPETLAFISPKTGRAVSMEEGLPYKEKLLHLPEFLKPGAKDMQKIGTREDVYTGLKMTGYFLENWVFAQHSKGIPPSRLRLEALFANKEGNIST